MRQQPIDQPRPKLDPLRDHAARNARAYPTPSASVQGRLDMHAYEIPKPGTIGTGGDSADTSFWLLRVRISRRSPNLMTPSPSQSRCSLALLRRDARGSELPFDERFWNAGEAEDSARHNRRLTRLLKDAELRIAGACLEDVEVAASRGVGLSAAYRAYSRNWGSRRRREPMRGPAWSTRLSRSGVRVYCAPVRRGIVLCYA
jgi:hypothetical protein